MIKEEPKVKGTLEKGKWYVKAWRWVKKVASKPIGWYYRLIDYLRYYKAVQMADIAHEKDNDRYLVMPSTDGKLIIVDRKNFRMLKRKGYINKSANIGTMLVECFYYTAGMNTDPISEEWRKKKYKEYLQWCKAMRILNHYGI